MQEGKILAVCISSRKGTRKKEVPEAVFVEDYGLRDDAHAGKWHRQVSLLDEEAVLEMQKHSRILLDSGIFGENLRVRGIRFDDLPVGTRFLIGPSEDGEGVLLELTQIGKECHDRCAIARETGKCVMPQTGRFAKVLRGGTVRPSDRIRVIPADPDRPYTAAVITMSDRCAAGEREDLSGPLCTRILTEAGYQVEEALILPDEQPKLEKTLRELSDRREISLIVTTGGTGFSDRDITPEATAAVIEKQATGIAYAMLSHALESTPGAMLSRQTAGIRKHSLIVNLPGSPKAVLQELPYVLTVLRHGLGILRGTQDN